MNGKRIIVSAQKQWIQQQQKPEFCVLSKEGILVLFELFTTYVIVLFFLIRWNHRWRWSCQWCSRNSWWLGGKTIGGWRSFSGIGISYKRTHNQMTLMQDVRPWVKHARHYKSMIYTVNTYYYVSIKYSLQIQFSWSALTSADDF